MKIRNCVATALVTATMLTAASPLHASELGNVTERLLAARKQEDFAGLYKEIDNNFGGDTEKIVAFLKRSGFSCQFGTILFKAKCVFAYCGDRSLFPPLRKELMTIDIIFDRTGEVRTGVAYNQTTCPDTATLLRRKQDELSTGTTPRRGNE
ncbi:hypothetical protein SO078_06155 [Sinorhizobium meliloti]|uniref:hypothetical protein n=1 Tax=Rhizobium meliloti TaxID=382 RepID=UPI002D77B5FA|nr:hypothetical protein [Sinorhizobium meliloti]WRQ68804.1 hypothetical protein SO078_06155 [Sinorhizobium meliloti]